MYAGRHIHYIDIIGLQFQNVDGSFANPTPTSRNNKLKNEVTFTLF